MTIQNLIDVRSWNTRLERFEACVEYAPEGTFKDAKAVREIIGRSIDTLIFELRNAGLPMLETGDAARMAEAVVYRWAATAPGNQRDFDRAEAFGLVCLDDETRAEAIQAAINYRDKGVIPLTGPFANMELPPLDKPEPFEGQGGHNMARALEATADTRTEEQQLRDADNAYHAKLMS